MSDDAPKTPAHLPLEKAISAVQAELNAEWENRTNNEITDRISEAEEELADASDNFGNFQGLEKHKAAANYARLLSELDILNLILNSRE